MAKKLLYFFLVFFTIVNSFSQEKKIFLFGITVDSITTVKNAHIINLNTNQGTFSSDNGTFQIFVSKGDSLQISSIQHITKKIVIDTTIINNKTLKVHLNSNVYVLDEFDLKRHNLTGQLVSDLKKIPKNRKDSLLKITMDFSNIDFSLKDNRIDENIRAMPKVANTVANTYSGLNAMTILKKINPFKKQKKRSNKEGEFNTKTEFSNKILTELGEDFFYKNLKIPKEKHSDFLEYCNHSTIEKLYSKNKISEIIEVLQKESITYLKIIKTK